MTTSGMKRTRVNYDWSLVTYTDILGFEELIDTRSAGQISRILRVLRESVQPAVYKTRIPHSPAEHFVNFSDLTITSTPVRKLAERPTGWVFWQLLHLVHAQLTLIADDGIFIRGAVTVGNVAKSYRLLYGPGIIDAYRMESKKAIHPRILVDQKVMDELAINPGLWTHDKEDEVEAIRKMLRKDNDDGLLYLDYLRASRREMEPDEYEAFLALHERRIKEGLEKHARTKRVREKYEWLDRYHRQTVRSLYRGN